MNKQSYWVPLALLIGGVIGALYILYLVFSPMGAEYVVAFAVASLVGAIGWNELLETSRFNEGSGEGFDGE